MRYGDYPARWKGKTLEVLVTADDGRTTVNRFQTKSEHDTDPN